MVLVIIFFSITSTSDSVSPTRCLDVVDCLPDLGELLREMFYPMDADQYCKDTALEELEEFGEDVLYDGELLAVGVSDGSCKDCGPY